MLFECYKKFVENLQEVEVLAETAETAFEISRKKPPEVTSENSSKARVQGNATTRAALVLLCGYLEGFIRDVAEEYVDLLNDENLKLEKYPNELFRAIIIEMSEALRGPNIQAVEEFKEYLREGKHPQLNKKKFSKTGGNPTVDTIEAVFKSLGIPDIIDKLSMADYEVESTYISESQVEPKMREAIAVAVRNIKNDADDSVIVKIVELIDSKWGPRRKRRKVGYVNEIEQLLKRRNRIAHGEGNEQVTTQELRDAIYFVKKLTDGLHTSAANAFVLLTT
jgi:DNA-binding phage protein